jgi:uncharacterized protein (TIGR02246 family)
MMFVGPAEDRLNLRELIDSYSGAVMRRDAAAWAQTWHPQARWIFRGNATDGKDKIVETWTRAMAGFTSVMFIAFPSTIEISDDTARMTTHTFEHLELLDGKIILQSGLYHDIAVRDEDGWRFTERAFSAQELKL